MKNNIFEIMTKKWNEKATDEFCHIKIDDKIKQNYIDYLGDINLEGKTVIDYGCGGGYLGKYLFKEKGIKKYIGFDICDKSIKAAKKNLKSYDAKIYKVTEHVDFSQYKANIFISFECIQHFPTFQYLLTFLKTVNESKIPEILLQIRIGKVTFVNNNVMTYMCKVPDTIITGKLNKYDWIRKQKFHDGLIKKMSIYLKSKIEIIVDEVEKESKKIYGEVIGEGREDVVIGESEENK
jgi:cyclopropane fatty-acyl-phospholipid synthase-like methyltransferase